MKATLTLSLALLLSPCYGVEIQFDQLSSGTNLAGSWHQRRLGSDYGRWQLPGGICLQLALSREGQLPLAESDPIDIGRWNSVSCQITCLGNPVRDDSFAVFHNDADNLWDDFQFRTNVDLDGSCYEFSFFGRYFPATDEWNGTFGSLIPPPSSVPDGGGTLVLLSGALASISALRRRSR